MWQPHCSFDILLQKTTLTNLVSESPQIEPYATIEKYTTYNGYQMKSEIIQLNGLNTGRERVITGSGTKALCNELKDILVTLSGVALGQIPIIGDGISVLEAFNDVFGSGIATGSEEDYLEVGVEYDRCNQFTYVETSPNIWELGLISQRVTVTRVDSEQYYFNPNVGGKTLNKTWTGSEHIVSPNYVNPWQAAYFGLFEVKEELLTAVIGGLTIQF